MSTRPEPVLDQAELVRRITGGLTVLLTVLSVSGLISTTGDAEKVSAALVLVTGGLFAVINYMLPRIRARAARELVTPLVDPVDADGVPLVRKVE